MAQIESIQIKLGLTKDRAILKQLKANKLWKEDKEGPYVPIMFDGTEFRIRPGKTLTLGRSIANALYRSSQIMVGNDWLGGEFSAYLERLGEYSITDDGQVVGQEDELSPTTCHLCKIDQKTFPRLARHLMESHKDDPRMLDDEDEQEAGAKSIGELDGAEEDGETVGRGRASFNEE